MCFGLLAAKEACMSCCRQSDCHVRALAGDDTSCVRIYLLVAEIANITKAKPCTSFLLEETTTAHSRTGTVVSLYDILFKEKGGHLRP
jgi:hypothetical protein